ncbi:MAG: FAD:protein FMN transferase [Burkholderiales bacterium]|nr:FAD:protein FMN transferase [Burkholderiales bacterium]
MTRRPPTGAPGTARHGDAWLFQFGAMGSDCEVHIAGHVSEDHARNAAQAAIAEVQRIEAKYSRYRADSVVSRINAAAGQRTPVPVDEETADLLAYADRMYWASDGLFDITSGVLSRAWDFRAGRVPTREALHSLRQCVGWTLTVLERAREGSDGSSFTLLRRGMEIDLGGFGKEYAADRAAVLLQERSVRHGFVNLGGDIRLVGPRPDGSAWQMAVRHPREEERPLATISLADGALATSGDYERYFIGPDGERYCHVLNPRTGWPVRAWRSISVVAPLCLAAGSICTIAMLKGEDALPFLRRQATDFLAVDAQGQVHRPEVAGVT